MGKLVKKVAVMKAIRAVALGVALLATPAMATERFDLVCDGRQKLSPLAAWKPFSLRMRIDLKAMIWCVEKCEIVLPIASIDAARITLSRSNPALRSAFTLRTVDRISGKYEGFWSGEREEASCSAAPFSGMPAPKF